MSAEKLANPPVLHQPEARRDTRDPRLRAGDAEQGAGGKSLVTHSEPRASILVSSLSLSPTVKGRATSPHAHAQPADAAIGLHRGARELHRVDLQVVNGTMLSGSARMRHRRWEP